MKKHTQLILSLILGSVLGLMAHTFYENPLIQAINKYFFGIVGQVFLRSIFMIVVPMVVSGLIIGVFQLTSHQGLARVAKRTLFFTLIASSCSVLIGVSLANLVQPGRGFTLPVVTSTEQTQVEKITSDVVGAKPVQQALLEIIPKNPIEAAAKAFEGEMLALMFFALLFGAALSKAAAGKSLTLLQMLQEVYDGCMVIVDWTMKLAPLAVFSLVFQSTFKFGYQVLFSLGYFVLVVVVALLLQQFLVYTTLLKIFTRRSPFDFFKKCTDVYLYAFATASSNATLPRSLELAEQELKLKPESSRFVLTIGSTANQNGTALFEGITVLFLAQVYGVQLDILQQIQVVTMSVLAGIGTAGVPGGSLPLIMILIQQMGIPAEGMGLILGVDRFLDMCRTTLNVSGDLVIAALVDED